MVNTSPQSSGFYSAVVAMYIAHLIKFSANGKLHSISIIIVFQFSTHTHTQSEKTTYRFRVRDRKWSHCIHLSFQCIITIDFSFDLHEI